MPFKRTAYSAFIFLLIVIGAGCTSAPEKEKPTATPEAGSTSPSIARDPLHVDGTFVAPGTDFSRYKRVIVTELSLNEANINLSGAQSSGGSQVLTDQDKRFFREEYTHAVVVNLIADGTYTTALSPADDVLLIKAKIVQIAPLVTDAKTTNPAMKSYHENVAIMVITMELYDSVTNKLIGTVISSRELGLMQANNNRTSANVQIQQAFAFWLRTLRIELDGLSRRNSPLDKLLRQ